MGRVVLLLKSPKTVFDRGERQPLKCVHESPAPRRDPYQHFDRDQRSSSTEASCNVIIACPREAPERRVEIESTSRLNGRPIRARTKRRARVRKLAAVR